MTELRMSMIENALDFLEQATVKLIDVEGESSKNYKAISAIRVLQILFRSRIYPPKLFLSWTGLIHFPKKL